MKKYALFCLVMNALHVYQLCEEYFRFDMTTSIEIMIPDEVDMPALTFCADLANLVKWENITLSLKQKLLRKQSWDKTQFEGKEPYMLSPDLDAGKLRHKIRTSSIWNLRYAISLKMQDTLNISQIFDITEDIDAVARQLWLPIPFANGCIGNPKFSEELHCNGSGFIPNQKFAEDTHSPYNVREAYLLDRHKCFPIEVSDRLPQSVNYLKTYQPVFGAHFLAEIQFNNFTDIYFYIHPKGHFMTLEDLQKTIKNNKRLIMSYETYKSKLLPFPYKTNCRDYQKEGLSTRAHCRIKCLRDVFLDKYQSVYSEAAAWSSDNMKILMNFFDIEVENPVHNICQTKCLQKECSLISFTSMNLEREPRTQEETALTVVASRNPAITTECLPAMPFITFLTNLLSTFGIWFGLSVWALSSYKVQLIMEKMPAIKQCFQLTIRQFISNRSNEITSNQGNSEARRIPGAKMFYTRNQIADLEATVSQDVN